MLLILCATLILLFLFSILRVYLARQFENFPQVSFTGSGCVLGCTLCKSCQLLGQPTQWKCVAFTDLFVVRGNGRKFHLRVFPDECYSKSFQTDQSLLIASSHSTATSFRKVDNICIYIPFSQIFKVFQRKKIFKKSS